jgi:hypothetical protein
MSTAAKAKVAMTQITKVPANIPDSTALMSKRGRVDSDPLSVQQYLARCCVMGIKLDAAARDTYTRELERIIKNELETVTCETPGCERLVDRESVCYICIDPVTRCVICRPLDEHCKVCDDCNQPFCLLHAHERDAGDCQNCYPSEFEEDDEDDEDEVDDEELEQDESDSSSF